METITKRELNQHTAAALEKVTADDDIVVTERGRPRWRITAVRSQDSTLERLERTGQYVPPAATPAPWADAPSGPSYTEQAVASLLDEMRSEH